MGQAVRPPIGLVSQPSRPITRLKQAEFDAYVLLQHLGRQGRAVPAVSTLRRSAIFLQNFLADDNGDAGASVRPRTEADGFPPGRLLIVSPDDIQARWGAGVTSGGPAT